MKTAITSFTVPALDPVHVVIQFPVDREFTITVSTPIGKTPELRVFKRRLGTFGPIEPNVTGTLFARHNLRIQGPADNQWVPASTEVLIEAHRLIQLGVL